MDVRLAVTRRCLLGGAVALFPLIWTRGFTFESFNIPKLTFLFVIVSLSIGLRLAEWVLTRSPLRDGGLWKPALAFAVPLAIAWSFSSYRGFSLFGLYSRYAGLVPYLAVVCLGLLLADAFQGRPERIVGPFLIGASGVGAVAIAQMLFLGARTAVESDTSYVTSTLGHSNFAGGFLAISLPVALTLWVRATDRRDGILAAAATATIGLGLLFTFSQGGWAAGAAGTAIVVGLLVREKIKSGPKIGVGLAALIATVSIGIVIASLLIPHSYAKFPGSLKTTVTRGFLWKTAASVAKDSPLVGVGPNVFAIEGVLHRPTEDALVLTFTKGDDPHSVPLAMLANGGLLTLAGYTIAILWGASRVRRRSEDIFGIALAGALVAYVVQATVSIDEVSLRFGFWVILASSAALGARVANTAPTESAPRATTSRRVGASLLVLASLAPGVAAIRTFLVADHHIELAMDALGNKDLETSIDEFTTAIDLRGDPDYRRLYGGSMGQLASIVGQPEGQMLIERMRKAFEYVRSFPDPQALALEGELLHHWSAYDPSAADEALAVLEEARRLDPNNPLLGVLVADVLIHIGDYEGAIAELTPYARVLTEEFPEYSASFGDLWSDLAIAQARAGHIEEATRTFGRVGEEQSCRTAVAAAILKEATRPTPTLGFICPQVLVDLVTDVALQNPDR
jgi:hypothetical protein